MYTCIAYDITSNRTRLRASKWCKKIGLFRLQKSVFAGKAPQAAVEELEKEVRALLAPRDKLVIMTLDKPAFLAMLQQSENARLQHLKESFMLFDL